MKLFRAFTTLLLCIAALTAQSRTLDEIRKNGEIIIATEGAYPPFNYFEGAKLTGFEAELGDAIAKKMGLTVEWKSLTFDALLVGLRQDRRDVVLASFGITDECSKTVGFTSQHYCSGGVIVSKYPTIKTADR